MKKRYLKEWFKKIKKYKVQIILALFFVLIAGIVNYICGTYATRMGSAAVTDIILDNIPSIDLTFLFVYFWLILIFFLFLYPAIMRVDKLHNVLFHFSLIVIVRSIFITLTHLKSPIGLVPVEFPWLFSKMSFENDLFFSGHAAIPLVGFFVFKGEKIRYVFLGLSILMAITVLLMHQHYTIDVLSAYFITYGTFKIGEWMKNKLDFISPLNK